MLISANCERSESTVVNDPAPATNGNAIGTMDAELDSTPFWISIPKIISIAMIKITKAPATAND